MKGERFVWIVLAALALLPLIGAPGYFLSLATRGLILALAALSLDFILGLGGLVSFGHAAFIGIGAYATGILIASGVSEVAVIVPVALSSAALFAVVTGALSLRTKGVAFIMITLAFGQMLFFLAQSLSAFGGDDGLTLAMRPTLLGATVFSNRFALFYIALGTLVSSYLLARRISASRFGRVLRASRDNAIRVSVLGYDVFRVRLIAIVISGMMGALAGILLATQSDFVSPAYMTWQRSGELLFMVILGGTGTLHGAIFGALAFLALEECLSSLTEHWRVLFGPMLVAFVLLTRGGLAGLLTRLRASQ